MKVQLNTSIAGINFSYAVGESVEIDKEFAQRLIASGQATEIKAKRATKAKNSTSK